MSNIDFLDLLLFHWKKTGFSFKKIENGNTALIRGEDILYEGKNIDEVVTKLRLSFSDDYLENKIRKS